MVVVSFDKVEGLTVVGENLQHKFSSLKDAFAFASECERNPYIKNVEMKRIDSPK